MGIGRDDDEMDDEDDENDEDDEDDDDDFWLIFIRLLMIFW